MKWYRSADGEQRVWFSDEEIEEIAVDELRRASLTPTPSEPVVDLERLIEAHLHSDLDQYAPLPADVLGATEFVVGGKPRVQINADLTKSAESRPLSGTYGRWRATMAHESAHVFLHRVLFELNPDQGLLFDADPTPSRPRLLRCLHRNIVGRGGGDWREVQANRGMAAVLMPASLYRQITNEEMDALGVARADLEKERTKLGDLIRRLAQRCGVSQQAAGIRLETLDLAPQAGSLSMALE